MTDSTHSWKNDAKQVGRGLLMGGADIIPGVSGGTVALILGIYERLVGAISRFDAAFFKMIGRCELRVAASYVDLRFLFALGFGILIGVAGLARLMHYLLAHQRSYTLAAFFGLIFASGLLVAKMARPSSHSQRSTYLTLGAVAAVFAFWLVGWDRLTPRPGHAYLGVCGMIAICAMILPGISGAYILLLLGKYDDVTGMIRRVTALEATASDFTALAVFAAGCAVGLLAFSKFLRWLLATHHDPTMAVLCGFMFGSLRRIWPFQIDTTPSVEKFKDKVFEPIWPDSWTGQVTACLAIAVGCAALVLVADHLAGGRARNSPAEEHV